MVSMNEDHRGVGFVHSTDESSNDAGGKGRTISCFCNQNIESTGGIKSMEKEKAEIASLVARYGRIQSLMKYVNSDTLKESINSVLKSQRIKAEFCPLADTREQRSPLIFSALHTTMRQVTGASTVYCIEQARRS